MESQTTESAKNGTCACACVSVPAASAPGPTLNILCAICNEFYRPNDVVFSTATCGHVFHKDCLLRWLRTSRSGTCPQCRALCHHTRVHRIYLNFSEPTELDNVEYVPVVPEINWIPLNLSNGEISNDAPAGAIQCGTDEDGNPTYVARVYYNNFQDLLPANYVPQKNIVYAPWGCRGHTLSEDVDILVDCKHQWIPAHDGLVPPHAIPTGYSELGETLYTARCQYEGLTILGKVHPSHNCMYFPFRGLEKNSSSYDVLTLIPRAEAQPEQQ